MRRSEVACWQPPHVRGGAGTPGLEAPAPGRNLPSEWPSRSLGDEMP
eukprot:CAMPEP_0181532614 /NCGR_PEP_ID=MMETSP1110-20121109/72712_1 /TAXON_ID=174948 /ORGANISM="Symbiodinium sp., Strain CCMP421" /LENGTH=46 /DNA_ID= /DNA_START= /DNA_END= /DNA_ORIENTATION=